MGGWLSTMNSYYWGAHEMKCLMLGLDNAGKTTILYKLKLGEVLATVPTIGCNVEVVTYNKLSLCVWDIGGQDGIRPLYRFYYYGTQVLIYVVDSNDEKRVDEAREELSRILDDPSFPTSAALLVYANKQDLPNAMSTNELTEKLGLHVRRNRLCLVQGVSALSGDGLWEGLDWLGKLQMGNK